MKIDQQNSNNLPLFTIKTEYRDPLIQKLTEIISYYECQNKKFIYETAAFFNASLIELDDLPEYTTLLQALIKNIDDYVKEGKIPKSTIRINFKALYKTVACKKTNPTSNHNRVSLKIKICDTNYTLKAQILFIQPSQPLQALPYPPGSDAETRDSVNGIVNCYKLHFKEGDLDFENMEALVIKI